MITTQDEAMEMAYKIYWDLSPEPDDREDLMRDYGLTGEEADLVIEAQTELLQQIAATEKAREDANNSWPLSWGEVVLMTEDYVVYGDEDAVTVEWYDGAKQVIGLQRGDFTRLLAGHDPVAEEWEDGGGLTVCREYAEMH